MITNSDSGTRIDEIAPDVYRISTPVAVVPGGFSFNQYLIRDEAPLLFHTGPRRMFPLVREAIAAVLPVATLGYVAFSHMEADECGSLNELLAVAPKAIPIAGQIAVMTSLADYADRPPQALADGETLRLGRHELRWCAAPHLPHGWECGYLYDETARTLLCGDLFTQGGAEHPPVTETGYPGALGGHARRHGRRPMPPPAALLGGPRRPRAYHACLCMAPPGVAMGPPCCAPWRRFWPRRTRAAPPPDRPCCGLAGKSV
jgi:flavorubredoxin